MLLRNAAGNSITGVIKVRTWVTKKPLEQSIRTYTSTPHHNPITSQEYLQLHSRAEKGVIYMQGRAAPNGLITDTQVEKAPVRFCARESSQINRI